MIKRIVFFFALFLTLAVQAQEKVSWSFSYNNETKEVEFQATIAGGWHLYSQHIKNDIGPVPTNFVYTESTGITTESPIAEPKPIQEYDENFEATLDFFKDQVRFTQKIKSGSKGTLTGYVTYMVCNDVMCLPPVDVPFTITIP